MITKLGTRKQANGVVFKGLSSSAYSKPTELIYSTVGIRQQQNGTVFSGVASLSYLKREQGTILGAVHNGIPVLKHIHNGHEVEKHYHNGVLIYNAVPQPSPADIGFIFGNIPDQMFISGYAETIDLNQYHQDTENVWPAGAMPWDGLGWYPRDIGIEQYEVPNNFIPNKVVTITGTLPAGVTWDKLSGKLIYDGTPLTGESEHNTISFSYANLNSNTFDLAVYKPQLEWPNVNDKSLVESVHDMYDVLGVDIDPVVVIKEGTYYYNQYYPNNSDIGVSLTAADSENFNLFLEYDEIIFLGEPGKEVIISGSMDVGFDDPENLINENYDNGKYVTLAIDEATRVTIKNIGMRYCRLASGGSTTINYFNVQNYRCCINMLDNFTFRYTQKDETQDLNYNISNIEGFWVGSSSSKHFMYGHGISKYNADEENLSEVKLYVNNYKVWEPVTPSKGAGEAFKSLAKNVYAKNIWLSHFRNPFEPALTPLTTMSYEKLFTLHLHQKAVLYNVKIFGNTRAWVLFSMPNRNMNALNSSVPYYFDYPSYYQYAPDPPDLRNDAIFPDWKGFESDGVTPWEADKSVRFHGDNANHDYTKNGLGSASHGALVPAPGFLAGATIDSTNFTKITVKTGGTRPIIAYNDGSFWVGAHAMEEDMPLTSTFDIDVEDEFGTSNTVTITLNKSIGGSEATVSGSITYSTGVVPTLADGQEYDVANMNFDATKPNPDWTPIDAPYWDTIGDISNPYNTHEAIIHKYLSFIEIKAILHSQVLNRTGRSGVSISYDAPETALYTFGPAIRLSGPPNYIAANNVFICNMDVSGMDTSGNNVAIRQVEDHADRRIVSYPHALYAPEDWVAFTTHGNVTEEKVGWNVQALPVWFKF